MMKTIFVKYSNERSAEFSIRTAICLDGGKRKVIKTPCSEKADKHVKNIYRWFEELEKLYTGKGLKINQCCLTDHAVEMEYLEGQTLEEVMDGYVERKEYDKVEETLDQYLSLILDSAQEDFYLTSEFQEVFGFVPEFEHMKSASVTDIDMVLNNVIVCDGWNLIDYEWTFDFPIPVEFVVYRVLHYYFETTGARNEILRDRKIYERFGISEERQAAYAQMEKMFQQYIIQGYEPLRMMYPRITPGVISVGDALEAYRGQIWGRLQLFWSTDGVIHERDSRFFSPRDGKNVVCNMEFQEPVSSIRLDPGERPCVVEIHRFSVNGRELQPGMYALNGKDLGNGLLIFEQNDPNILYEENAVHSLELEWLVMPLSEELTGAFKTLTKKSQEQEQLIREEREKAEILRETIAERDRTIRDKNQVIEQKRLLIREMENTKVWKAYRKYRRLKERNKE